MTSEYRKIARHSFVYGAGILASKIVSVVMLPVYTHYLTPTDFGILELLETTIDVISMLAGMGLAQSVFKYHSETAAIEEQKRMLSTALIGNAAVTFIVAVIGVLCAPLLNRLVFGSHGNPTYFRIFFLCYFFQSVANLGLAIVRVEERSTLYIALTLARLVLKLSLNIWFVVWLHFGVVGLILGNTIGSAALAAAVAVYCLARFGAAYSHRIFKRLSAFGAPIGISLIGSFILTYSDRYFLNHYWGAAPVGVYSLGYAFSFLLSSAAAVPFGQIWEPRRFAIAGEPDAGAIYRRMFFYLNLALFVGATGIVLFAKDALSLLVAPGFVPAYRVVPLLLVTTIIQQWTMYCNFGLYVKNATRVLIWTSVIASATALLGNWLLIPRYGMMGAASATLLAYVVRFLPIYFIAQAKYYIRYPWGKVATLSGALAAALAIRSLLNSLPIAASLALSAASLVACAWLLYGVLFTSQERSFLREMLHRPIVVLTGRWASPLTP